MYQPNQHAVLYCVCSHIIIYMYCVCVEFIEPSCSPAAPHAEDGEETFGEKVRGSRRGPPRENSGEQRERWVLDHSDSLALSCRVVYIIN